MILFYTTNLTVLKDELFDLWSQFGHIYLGVSIDGYGEVDDYIRYPSKWEKLEKNIKTVSKWRKELSMDLKVKLNNFGKRKSTKGGGIFRKKDAGAVSVDLGSSILPPKTN